MYVSKYYTCEEIDQRLLQGYYDDFVKAGFGGTINEFWAFVLSIKNKVDKKEGYDLSKNDFTDELKAKLDGIEEHANYITKVSQLENDLKYQTEEEVKQMISDLVDGADDALDTLKELAEALGNDPNFATTITNKLTDLRTALTEEVNRAKEVEAALGAAVAAVQDNLEYGLDQINKKIDTVKADLKAEIDRVEKKVDKNAEDIKDLEDKVNQGNDELEKELKDLIQKEKDERIAADNEIKESVNELKTLHINDKAALEAKIAEETANRTNADTVLDSKINEEITNRRADTLALQGKIDQEKVDRHSEDQALHNEISKEVTDRTNADNALQGKIDQEAQARTAADQVLQNNIDSEATTRAAQDLILEHKIDDVKEQGVEDKEQLLNAIAVEAAAREKGDKDLDAKKVDKREGYSLTKNDFTDILKAKLDGIEEKANYITHLSQLINDAGFQTEEEVNAAIQKIIGSAPEVLDTLKEIADALGNDPNFAATMTAKLTELGNKLEAEKNLREQGDNTLQQTFTNLSNTLTTTVNKLRTFVTETRTELLTSLNATNALVTRNAANIQRNLGLIQGIQDNINGNYTAITDLLNNEIAARKAEDIRLEAKIDQNTSDLNTEREERKAADKVLQDNIDAEEAARIAADTALDKRIDKEIQDRTDADTALDNKFTNITDDHEERLVAEEGTSDALPDTMVTNVSTVTRTGTQLSFKVKTSTKDKANNQYGEEVEATKNLLPVTQTLAGVMSAADKVKLDGLDPNSLTDLSAASDANKVTVTVTKDNGLNADTTETFDLPQVSATKAGTMTAKDKVELDRISTANFALGAVTPNETTVGIAATKTVVEDGTVEQNPITLPASTAEKAGVQTAADKKLFDSIPDNIIILSGDKPVEVGQQSSNVTLTHNFSSKKEEGIYTHEPEDYKTTHIPAATTEKAGVMTAQDKVNLDETLPNAIAQEVQDRKDAIEALNDKSEAALAQEVADRKAADTALDTKFTKAVNDEATARTSADTALGARIDKEIADRTAADTALDTKLQNNINTLEAKHDAFVATKGKADGFAPLDGNGLVPANHLPSYVDDVLEVYATYDVSPTGGLTNVQLYTDAGHQTPVVGESGKIYINVADGEPPYQFRWSGTKFVDSNTSSLIIGEISGTAFEGSRGKHLEDVVSSMPKNLISKVSIANKNKRNVIILCNYSATDGQGHYIDKPDGMVIPLTPATTKEAGLMDADSVIKLNQTLPDAIEAEQEARIAKDNAHDTFNSSLPGIILTGFTLTHNSTNVRATLNNKTKSADGKTYEGATDLIRDILAATKITAGVMTAADKTNLDNTVQGLANEITNRTNAINALRTELKTYVDDLIADTGSDVTALETKVNSHIANKSNPHGVTKSQVGLGNASNTSDANKPVSTAQAAAIADAKAAGTAAQTSINNHAGRKDNPHTVTRAQLGLATTDQVVFAKTTAPSGFFKESSDVRLKSDIKDLNHTLEQICQIPTKSFEMLGKEDEGTIAQNLEGLGFDKYVEEVPVEKSTVPNPEEFETLEINGEEYVLVKQVKYHKMSTLAIEGVKLLYDEIRALKAEIQELKNR